MPEAVDGTLVRLPFDFNPTAKGCGSLSRSGAGPRTRPTNEKGLTGGWLVSQEVAMPSTFKGTQSNPSHLLLGHLDVLLHLLQRLARRSQ